MFYNMSKNNDDLNLKRLEITNYTKEIKMHKYHEMLLDVLNNGHYNPNNPIKKIIIGRTVVFKLQDGFPFIKNSDSNFSDSSFKEMFWFIKGSNDISLLKAQGVNTWNNLAVNGQTVEDLLVKVIPTTLENHESISTLYRNFFNSFINSVGHTYGTVWRFSPVYNVEKNTIWPDLNMTDIASDKLNTYISQYNIEKPKDEKGNEVSLETYIISMHHSHIDQLQLLITGLKKNPYEGNHVVTSWLPSYIPYSNVSPQENVIMNKAAAIPENTMFQCTVVANPNPNGKPLLNLHLHQRSVDVIADFSTTVSQYAFLLSLLAHVTDMEPNEFIYSIGEAYIKNDPDTLVATIETQLSHNQIDPVQLKFNPEKTDIYTIVMDDIIIGG